MGSRLNLGRDLISRDAGKCHFESGLPYHFYKIHMSTHVSTEGIEIEVSDMPDELAELRAFVIDRVQRNIGSKTLAESAGDEFNAVRFAGAQGEAQKTLSEIDRLIAARGK